MSGLQAPGFPADAVRCRARVGCAAVFPAPDAYGHMLLGATPGPGGGGTDPLDEARLVPPVFMPHRLEKLFDLAREPLHSDVSLATSIGGFSADLPLYVSAFGSTRAASGNLGLAVSTQAAELGIPMVIGENTMPVNGYGRTGGERDRAGQHGTSQHGDGQPNGGDAAQLPGLLGRIRAYAGAMTGDAGGVVVQQSTEDADAEVWNQVYSDPAVQPLLQAGRLGFELKTGQGAKPGLGGLTVVTAAAAARLAGQYAIDEVWDDADVRLRSASPGTFTAEILRQQVHLMRNNFPRARIWVKLHPGRDVAEAATVAWAAGADAVTVDGAEGGSGWAPLAFAQVGLPLGECLLRIRDHGNPLPNGSRPGTALLSDALPGDALPGTALPGTALPGAAPPGDGPPGGSRLGGPLLVSGRMWEGVRTVKALALGATAAGLGRAALLAADEDPRAGLRRLCDALALEARLLISALGKYTVADLAAEDLWLPTRSPAPAPSCSCHTPGLPAHHA